MSIQVNDVIIDVPYKARVLLFVEANQLRCYEILKDNQYVQTIQGFMELVEIASGNKLDE